MPKFWNQKTYCKTFLLFLLVLSLNKDFSSQLGDTNFVLALALKWEQKNSFSFFIQLIIISSEADHFISRINNGEDS